MTASHRPNFILIGAQKSGTTSLMAYLAQHPDVFVSPIKEPRYYSFLTNGQLDFPTPDHASPEVNHLYLQRRLSHDFRKDWDAYQALFRGAATQRIVAEGSVWYLYNAHAAERIQADLPNVKLLAMLRNPVDRAYSRYLHLRREGFKVPATFAESWREADERTNPYWPFLWHMRNKGLYHDQVSRYTACFKKEQFRTYIFELDFIDNTQPLIKEIFQFLNIDDSFEPDMDFEHNVTGLPEGRLKRVFFSMFRAAKSSLRPVKTAIPLSMQQVFNQVYSRWLTKVPLDPTLRDELLQFYAEDILKLQDLLKRDLSVWFAPTVPNEHTPLRSRFQSEKRAI